MDKRIDHLVIVAAELDALTAFYSKLGFQVGTRNRHDWGTLNHIIQFDQCFLELLTTEDGFERPINDEPTAPFAGFVEDFLKRHPGASHLVLSSADAKADYHRWQQAGIAVATEPLTFGREGIGAAGKPTKVAFTLAFAESQSLPNTGFFVCQQHHPENFWFADRQVHANGVLGVSKVVLLASAEQVAGAGMFLAAYSGFAAVPLSDCVHDNHGGRDELRSGNGELGGLICRTIAGDIEVRTCADGRAIYGDAIASDLADGTGGLAAVHFKTADLIKTEHHLSEQGVGYLVSDGRLTVPAHEAFGLALVFEAM